MTTMSFAFTGLRKDGSKGQVTITEANLRLCEKKAKETFVKIIQTVRVANPASSQQGASAA